MPSRFTRALRHRNYRLFFGGQSISLIGTWITRIATSWLVYRLTGSELLLGVVGFAGQIPMLILAPFAGVFVDRWDRHRLLVVTQILSALQSLALAVLTMMKIINVTELIALQVFQGIINSFDTPARQAFVVEMVTDREDLPNAIALNSSMFNASRIVGPSVGGVLIAAVGEGWCFMADAISYIAVIISLLLMDVARVQRERGEETMFDELNVGVRYVAQSVPVRTLLILVAIVSTMGMPYAILMPAIASSVLHGGPHTLGVLMTASGAGALVGTFYLASRKTVLGLGKVIVAATVILSVGLIAFSLTKTLWVALLSLPLVGAGMMLQSASTNTILQTVVDEDLRGRVMAFYTMAILGTQPLGSLVAGVMADRIGAQYTILVGAIVCLAAAAWFALRRPAIAEHIRPIYMERGILPWDGDATLPVNTGRIH
jgi:MFS family permease